MVRDASNRDLPSAEILFRRARSSANHLISPLPDVSSEFAAQSDAARAQAPSPPGHRRCPYTQGRRAPIVATYFLKRIGLGHERAWR